MVATVSCRNLLLKVSLSGEMTPMASPTTHAPDEDKAVILKKTVIILSCPGSWILLIVVVQVRKN